MKPLNEDLVPNTDYKMQKAALSARPVKQPGDSVVRDQAGLEEQRQAYRKKTRLSWDELNSSLAKSVESDGRDVRLKNVSGGSNLDLNMSMNQQQIRCIGEHQEDETENEISPNARYKIIKKNKGQSGLNMGGSDAGS